MTNMNNDQLREKLANILYLHLMNPGELDMETSSNQATDAILSAISEAGYTKDKVATYGKSVEEVAELLSDGVILEIYGKLIMTGKSWYERFTQHFRDLAIISTDIDGCVQVDSVYIAAKRASGMDPS